MIVSVMRLVVVHSESSIMRISSGSNVEIFKDKNELIRTETK